jgi:2-polyprenyl-3-methyl-5-hydroxy-6-metoxy-1,4-benzoquinol methylase
MPNAWRIAREMQFGTRHLFDYFQCAQCESLQIGEIPENLGSFYPPTYLGHAQEAERNGGLSAMLRERRNRAALTGQGILGSLLNRITRYRFGEIGRWLVDLDVSLDARILDVGCGGGQLLRDLATAGYRNLNGIDPLIDGDRAFEDGVRLNRRTIHEEERVHDVILFIHSFEHVPDPAETLASARRLLARRGWCIVWTPTVPCHAWAHYGTDWVQLDAPRHLFIPSPRAMEMLAHRAGLVLREVRYNSDHLQFTGSELYRRDLPLMGNLESISRSEIRRFNRAADKLNVQRRGDQAAFFLTKRSQAESDHAGRSG